MPGEGVAKGRGQAVNELRPYHIWWCEGSQEGKPESILSTLCGCTSVGVGVPV